MAENDRLILFAISMGAVILVAVLMWLRQELELLVLRKTLTRESVLERFCSGRYFDLEGLMRVFRVSPRPHDVTYTADGYEGCLGKRIRLFIRRVGDNYVLDDIQRYLDKNWQFTGWYDEYQKKRDHESLSYIVTGAMDFSEAEKRRQLPGFMLTKDAIQKIFDEFKEGAN